MTNVLRKYGFLFLIPGIVLVFTVLMKLATGPYWLSSNFDPSYLYLCNGLHILKGAPLNEATHPGTPVQMLCSLVCWLFNIGRPVSLLAMNVFKDPDFYLHAAFAILAAMAFISSIGLGIYVFRKTNDRLAALLTQLPALSFLVLKSRDALEPVFPVVANVSPEPMLITILNLFNICLFLDLFADTKMEKLRAALVWGFLCGLGTAVKFTFFPLLVTPLTVLGWRNRFYFLGLFTAAFFLWTIPAESKYQLEWGWISGFFVHRDGFQAYQVGNANIISFLLNWKTIVLNYWLFMGGVLASSLLILWKLVNKKWDKRAWYLLATILGVLCQFSIVAKNPGEHYLLPGMGLFSALLVLTYWQCIDQQILFRRFVIVFILAVLLAGVWKATEYYFKVSAFHQGIIKFNDYIHTKYNGYVFLGYYRASGQEGALRFGDAWNGEAQFSEELFRVYPNSYFFNRGASNRMVSFGGRVLSNDLLARYKGVIFQGDDTYGPLEAGLKGSPFSAQLLEKGNFESIYLLTKTTEKQALMLILAANHFLQEKDYKKALECALQSKAYHFQPEDEIDSFIRFIASNFQQKA